MSRPCDNTVTTSQVSYLPPGSAEITSAHKFFCKGVLLVWFISEYIQNEDTLTSGEKLCKIDWKDSGGVGLVLKAVRPLLKGNVTFC